MVRNHIIPMFIPHIGCPPKCVFCDQRRISGAEDVYKRQQLERVGKPGTFRARFYGDPKKRELKNEAAVSEVLKTLEGGSFSVASVKRSEKKRSPAPPFITSTLQQEASRKLNMTPKRTMAIAQQLYEGIDITSEGRCV